MKELRTYSISGVIIPAALADGSRRQATLVVRASSRTAALRAFSAALGDKITMADWNHGGQVDVPKFALALSTVPPGVVLYERHRWSGDWMRLDAGSVAR